MTKLPEGRKPLPNEWFIDRAERLSGKDIREMDEEERKRASERDSANSSKNKGK